MLRLENHRYAKVPAGTTVNNTNAVPVQNDELGLDPRTPAEWREARELGHRMVDDMFEFLENVRERGAWQAVPNSVKQRLNEPVPVDAQSLESIYDQFRENILPFPTGNIHPRFWGWVMGTGTVPGMLAQLLEGAMNAHVAGYDQAAAVVERQVLLWLADLVGFRASASGILVSGGTMANLIGLAVGRNTKAGFDIRREGLQGDSPRLCVYGSTETHSWATRGCELLGLGRSALKLIPVDGDYRIDIGALRAAIERDLSHGNKPICVIGNAGTVNTGAIDDLEAIGAVCREFDLWYHIDGAFGAMAALAPRLRDKVEGMTEADSLAFDLHKWGYVQYEAGVVLVRDAVAHRASFAMSPAYLQPALGGISVDPLYFADLGVQLSREFRALKIWMSLKAQGARQWGDLIQQNFDQAQHLARLVTESRDLQLLAPAPLNVVCFRYVGGSSVGVDLDELNAAIVVAVQERGIAVPSSTYIGPGERRSFAIRVAITNHRTRREDIDVFVSEVRSIGRELAARSTRRPA